MEIPLNRKYQANSNHAVALKQVDSVEIISVIDNSIDLLSTASRKEVEPLLKWMRERKEESWVKKHFRLPIAEHGFSMLVRVYCEGEIHTVLFDVGGSPEEVVTNAYGMGLNLHEIESIVISHGHYDHFGGLVKVLKDINKSKLPVIVHENMFKTRGVAEPNGNVRKYPDFPLESQVKPATYVRTKQPHLLADDTILVTGEIPRKTEFEKGFPRHRILINGKWQPDPWIWDDRALVINVKRKGLVVLSGCAHAGIVNTSLYAQQLTGTTKIHAILGGFHLAGKEHEPIMDKTVKKLRTLNPTLIAPSHCTGWRGAFAIAKEMPKAFVWNNVGNLYRFQKQLKPMPFNVKNRV